MGCGLRVGFVGNMCLLPSNLQVHEKHKLKGNINNHTKGGEGGGGWAVPPDIIILECS